MKHFIFKNIYFFRKGFEVWNELEIICLKSNLALNISRVFQLDLSKKYDKKILW